jgi:hypothetical protein
MQHDVHLKFSNAPRMQTWGAWTVKLFFLSTVLSTVAQPVLPYQDVKQFGILLWIKTIIIVG